MKVKHFALVVVIALALTEFFRLVSGTRVLLHEVKVNPGDHYVVADHGDLGTNAQASLACSYFTARSVRVTVFWYASNNFLGKDQCPFITGKD